MERSRVPTDHIGSGGRKREVCIRVGNRTTPRPGPICPSPLTLAAEPPRVLALVPTVQPSGSAEALEASGFGSLEPVRAAAQEALCRLDSRSSRDAHREPHVVKPLIAVTMEETYGGDYRAGQEIL